MGKAISSDMRLRIVRGISSGKTRRAIAGQFEVAPATQGRPKGSGKLGPFREAILAKVEAQPEITMPDLAVWLETTYGLTVDPSNLSKLLCAESFTYKKTLLAAEKERADVRVARRSWMTRRQPFMRRNPGRLVFLDETSIKTNMTPLRGEQRGASG